ncbi:Phosphoserine phosphatase RsbU [Clavibacter michiganensis]|uniref:Phosphoserine phosphatase RsbU n=1 Tax=Clavibacter michiganensis TaxID=28447 RepID=A0A251Y0G7_9MICO|nr:PP2C family protein-serine/threonine phosphatase [Clavibacter michiganensis]OUE17816.1 Phosphoserine phosphatase RsbU [Clavibacter michiganensis]OUE30786.1 Phosphoserine phosphatase RsbU [Clavibacter michiganensis]
MDTDLRERRRLQSLEGLHVFGTAPETRFDRITVMIAEFYHVPLAAVGIIGADAIWMKSSVGFPSARWPRHGTLTDASLDAADGMLVVEDALLDERLAVSPSVTGPLGLRFYAAQQLRAPDGNIIGAFFIADTAPRAFGATDRARLALIGDFFSEELAHETDSRRAVEVARALSPLPAPHLTGYEVAGTSVPALVVGGDVHDWFLEGGELRLTLADVMGKGVGAAILAAGVRATVRLASRTHGVRSTMVRAAGALIDDLSIAGSFSTLFHARLALATGTLTFVDAGHGLAFLLRADGSTQRLSGRNLPLGLEAEDAWVEETAHIGPGDALVIFSDGILDFFDDDDGAYAYLAGLMAQHPSARGFIDALIALTPVDQPDDCTVIAVRRLAA